MPARLTVGVARLRALAAALLVAAVAAGALLTASLAGPSDVAALGPLPTCRYADVLTAPRDYDDWSITLVDTILEVPSSYIPPDLVAVSTAGIGGSGKVRAVAVADLRAMTAAAAAAGDPIAVQSAYRSYATQEATFQYWVSQDGYKTALLYSARPGHSEHQLGLAIDFRSAAGSSPFGGDWGTTAAGTWMRLHAWQYGWVQSYPKNEQAKTCYAYEAWHFRYVGRPLASKIHASGLTVREYLWAHFTTAVVATASKEPASPAPRASGSPEPSAHPSSAPEASPSPSVSPSVEPNAGPSSSPPPGPADSAAPAPASAAPLPPAPAGTTADPGAPVVVLLLIAAVALIAATVALRVRRGTVGWGL